MTDGGMAADQVARRRAIEALRSGVPSGDAVAALGSGQVGAEDRFDALIAAGEAGRPGGLLLGAGFGAGKSHLLTHLARLALDRGFAVSSVVVSKETPLHDPVKVYRAALDSLLRPGRIGGGLSDVAASLDPDTPSYLELTRWLRSPSRPVDERFAATLYLHERLSGGDIPDGDESVDSVVRFWSGDPLRVSDLRRALKAVGAQGLFNLTAVPARELARQRMRFTTRLLRAAGCAGWVVLFDEVELIGRYSLLQRGRSYAEIRRWMAGEDDDPDAPLVAVLAMTDDYEAAVLRGKDDRTVVPARLRDKQTPEWTELAGLAAKGITHIERDLLMLEPPDAAELDRSYAVLKELHGAAYDWSPPDVAGIERLGATRMRQYVRAWINAWDLVRLDPDFEPESEVVDVLTSYDEDPALDEEPA